MLVLIPVIIAALNALSLEAMAGEMLSTFLEALPLIFAAVLLMTVAFVAGRVIATLSENLLRNIGLVLHPGYETSGCNAFHAACSLGVI